MKKLLVGVMLLTLQAAWGQQQIIQSDVFEDGFYKPKTIKNGTEKVSTETIKAKTKDILLNSPYFRNNYKLSDIDADIKVTRSQWGGVAGFLTGAITGEEVILTLDSKENGHTYKLTCDWYTKKQEVGTDAETGERFRLELQCYKRENLSTKRKDEEFKWQPKNEERHFMVYWDEDPGRVDQIASRDNVDNSSRHIMKDNYSSPALRGLTEQTII